MNKDKNKGKNTDNNENSAPSSVPKFINYAWQTDNNAEGPLKSAFKHSNNNADNSSDAELRQQLNRYFNRELEKAAHTLCDSSDEYFQVLAVPSKRQRWVRFMDEKPGQEIDLSSGSPAHFTEKSSSEVVASPPRHRKLTKAKQTKKKEQKVMSESQFTKSDPTSEKTSAVLREKSTESEQENRRLMFKTSSKGFIEPLASKGSFKKCKQQEKSTEEQQEKLKKQQQPLALEEKCKQNREELVKEQHENLDPKHRSQRLKSNEVRDLFKQVLTGHNSMASTSKQMRQQMQLAIKVLSLKLSNLQMKLNGSRPQIGHQSYRKRTKAETSILQRKLNRKMKMCDHLKPICSWCRTEEHKVCKLIVKCQLAKRCFCLLRRIFRENISCDRNWLKALQTMERLYCQQRKQLQIAKAAIEGSK
ncbi:hypothetical protein ACLKA6_016197 [Drosophila palustris]